MSHHVSPFAGPYVWGAGARLSAVSLLLAGLWLAVAWALGWLG